MARRALGADGLEALPDRSGLSRTVLTSHVPPPPGVTVIPVHALPLDEALLPVRELPHLGRHVFGAVAERELVRRALRMVQVHPELTKDARLRKTTLTP